MVCRNTADSFRIVIHDISRIDLSVRPAGKSVIQLRYIRVTAKAAKAVRRVTRVEKSLPRSLPMSWWRNNNN